jgi:HSP20 family molecular chaperone IbpA
MATVEKRAVTPANVPGAVVPITRHLELAPSRLWERLDKLMSEWEPLWTSLRIPQELAFKTPAIDVYEDQGVVVVETELPGLKKEDVEVTLAGDLLTISGKRESEKKVDRKDYYRLERSASAVSRSVRLPVDVQADRMTATLKDGVLEIRAPRTEAAKAGSRSVPVT